MNATRDGVVSSRPGRAARTRQYNVLAIYAGAVGTLLFIGFHGEDQGGHAALAFVSGAALSLLAGFFGMKAAGYRSARMTETARPRGMLAALVTAFDAGTVMGLCAAGIGLISLAVVLKLFAQAEGQTFRTVTYGFAAGASSIALFARTGGGIYVKAADIYGSYVAAVVAAIALGLTLPAAELQPLAPDAGGEGELRAFAVGLPILLATIGLVASFGAILVTRTLRSLPPARVLRVALLLLPLLTILGAYLVLPVFGITRSPVAALGAGTLGGAVIGMVIVYYTSMRPVRLVAHSALTGPGTLVIRGLAVGLESCAVPLLTLCAVGWASNEVLGWYGIALAAIGMLAGTAVVMTGDAGAPIAGDGDISQSGRRGPDVRLAAGELDAIGRTTAAVGKGFAIGAAVLTVVALFAAFSMEVDAARAARDLAPLNLSLVNADVLMGVLCGAVLPCLVAASSMNAVGRGAGAVKAMLLTGSAALATPVLVGFGFGATVLAGALMGALTVGATLSMMLANAGGAWHGAKQLIEEGGLPGHAKGSFAHEAVLVGDTVGDLFSGTSSPAITILIKVLAVVSLLIAPLLLQP